MQRLAKAFRKGPTFIGYLTGGDGGEEYCTEAALALAAGGVDILELGIPFSDPVADGPVIQAAMRRSLSSGTTPHTLLKIAKGIRRQSSMPLIAFSYYNPILQGGEKLFFELKEAGFDGMLVVDLPLEEAEEHIESLKKAELDPILIATPATTPERIKSLATMAQGFIYYACQKGTTGVRKNLPSDFDAKVQTIKSLSNMPVAAGFGIAEKATARLALQQADGFVVGSAFVNCIAKGGSLSELQKLAESIDPRSC
jgi:tryptophan synthase alpha chain